METKKWAIALVMFTTILNAFAQILYKAGANILKFDFYSLITNYFLIFGVVLYGISAILLIIALKNGELSVLYPVISTGFIWVSLLSIYFFEEVMNLYKWAGIFFIVVGVSFIGYGGTK